MAPQITEIVYIPLRPDVDLDHGDAGNIWTDTLNTIATQPGCQSVLWGRQVEQPKTAELVIDWATLDDHKTFMASPTYKPFYENLSTLLDGPVKLYHVESPSSQSFSTPGSAPVTECISIYFEPSYSTAAYDASFAKFADVASKTADEAQGVVGGWSIEDHEHEKVEGAAKLFAVFIGWPSVEAHMKYRQTEGFKECIPHLREGPKALQMHHVAFKKHLS
ncbi:hypothetical protein BU24DRAFT_426850 [Aaosphaeria arxii CBS 175.79]|uniref:ABM domain-containing protein n=1 Tax=Aaosphaeria arxii CBS 175.79 TaxID=1450172 RepID=A0A6A5XFZ5_9PLEO|nr:uncharacterized protein BU24DRAFT_426850 [Aaosphaeria arxii CBS 175.79]KAF2011751.1 hypothetical protein BU24DRAFT_426850 [Aaosphaeria arxii CBS 175.79]